MIPIAGQIFTFYITLEDAAIAGLPKFAPTLDTVNDFRISINDGALAALTTAPSVLPAGSQWVKITFTAAETTSAGSGGRIKFSANDSVGGEWYGVDLVWPVLGAAISTLTTAQVNTEADTALSDVGLTTTITGRVDAAISTRLATASYTAADNSTITTINTKLGTPAGASLAADIAALPAAVWAVGTRTLTSVSALLTSISASVWAYTTRSLTGSAAEQAASIAGSRITITKGSTYTATITGLSIPSDWTKMIMTGKGNMNHPDSNAEFQISVSNPGAGSDGLQVLNRAVAETPAQASLVVTQASGTVAIMIKDEATLVMELGSSFTYDLKVLHGSSESTVLTRSAYSVVGTPTQAVN